jgi:coproporphyrinogen III oxidase-like Fe-S oxidoreductase
MDSVRATGGWSSVVDLETPSAPRALAERIMTGLRLREGLDLTDLLERAESFGAGSRLRREIDRFADRGELEIGVDGRLRLADQGWLFADGIAASLMDALSSRP